MKRKKIEALIMASAFSLALVFGSTMNAHAFYYDEAGTAQSEGGGGCSESDGSDDIGGGSSSSDSSDSGSSDNYDSGSSGSNDSYEPSYDYSSGSSDNSSYDSGSSGSSYDSGSGSSTSNSGTAATNAWVPRNSSTVTIPGHETWRKVASRGEGIFRVIHKGNEECVLQLRDAEGSATGCAGLDVVQSAEGVWYVSFTTHAGTDSSAFTVLTAKGSATYLNTLGVTGIMIDGRVVTALTVAEIMEAQAGETAEASNVQGTIAE